MTASAYLSAMGPDGIRNVAEQCASKAHFLAGELEKIGFTLPYGHFFFHEFVTTCPCPAENVLKLLDERGILGGLQVGEEILWCCTENNSREQIDELIQTLRGMKR